MSESSEVPALASRIARSFQVLAGVEATGVSSAAELLRLLPRAAELLNCSPNADGERMGRRRTRWRPLLRRALAMATASYGRLLSPLELRNPGLATELSSLGQDVRAAIGMAERIAAAEPSGLRSILVLGDCWPLAAAIGRLTQQRVFLVPWVEGPADEMEALRERLGLDIAVQDPMQPGQELPFWLKGRFQSVFLQPPLDPVASHKSVAMAMSGLERVPGRRLYWTGHPARHAGYFGLYSLLGRHGMFLERLEHDVAALPLDPDFAQQLLEDLLETPEVAESLDALVLEDLLAARVEHEHLHVMRPIEEVVLRGHRLELVPVKTADIPLYDSWLTPEFCQEVGLEDQEPRPTVEQLRVANWYPNHEWWMFRTLDGVGVGVVNLMLHEFWATRRLPFDIGVAERAFRGQGLLNEAVRLSFARVFGQLGAEALWAMVRVANVRICRGYRSNFFKVKNRLFVPETGEEHEYIEITAEDYRSLRSRGDIDVPVEG